MKRLTTIFPGLRSRKDFLLRRHCPLRQRQKMRPTSGLLIRILVAGLKDFRVVVRREGGKDLTTYKETPNGEKITFFLQRKMEEDEEEEKTL